VQTIKISLILSLTLSILPLSEALAQPGLKSRLSSDTNTQDKSSEAALTARAKTLMGKKAWASAIRTLEEVLKKNQNSAEALYLMAFCLDQQNKLPRASDYINQALKLKPNYPEAIKLRIRITKDGTGDLKSIFADLTQLEKLTPQDAWIYVHRADLLQVLGENKKAAEEFAKGISLGGNGDLPWCYHLQSVSYRAMHDYKKALESTTKAINLEPKNGAFYNNRANIREELKDYPGAIADFSKAIELNPGLWKDGTGTSWANRGLVYRLTNQHKKAVSDFTQALKLMPKKAYLYIYRSLSYCQLGQYNKAIADANKALEIAPNNLDAFQARYQAESKSGDLEQALADFNTIQQLSKSNKKTPEIQQDIGSKKWQDIAISYSKIIKMKPQAADSYYNRGLTYLCAGQWQLASHDFQKYLSLSDWNDSSTTSAILLNYIAYCKSGSRQEAENLLRSSIKRNKNLEWPYPILCYYRRQSSEKQLLATTGTDTTKLTMAKCYLGIDQAIQGNRTRALESLNWVHAKGNPEIDEYMVAMSFRKELQKSPAISGSK
jgi:tetratricopeptide (TPR) repeat protein